MVGSNQKGSCGKICPNPTAMKHWENNCLLGHIPGTAGFVCLFVLTLYLCRWLHELFGLTHESWCKRGGRMSRGVGMQGQGRLPWAWRGPVQWVLPAPILQTTIPYWQEDKPRLLFSVSYFQFSEAKLGASILNLYLGLGLSLQSHSPDCCCLDPVDQYFANRRCLYQRVNWSTPTRAPSCFSVSKMQLKFLIE